MISEAAMWWWGGVSMAVIAAGGMVWAVGGDWWKTRKLRKAGGLRRCRKCLFDMNGLTTLVCPECGKKAKSEKSLRGVRRRWGVVSVCMMMLSVSWVVRNWPQIRDARLEWVPTWAIMMAGPIADVFDPEGAWDKRWNVNHEVRTRYYAGDVSPICDLTLMASRRVSALVSENRAGVDSRLVETHFDLRPWVREEEFTADPPHMEPGVYYAIICGDGPSIAYYPQDKTDWTRKSWSRRQQYQCYLGAMWVVRNIAEFGAEGEVHYELNLANQELIRWGDSAQVELARAAAHEFCQLNTINRLETRVWFSPGTMVNGEIVRLYYWRRDLSGIENDLIRGTIDTILSRDDALECSRPPFSAGPGEGFYETIVVVRAEPQWQEEICAAIFEAARESGARTMP